MAAWSKLSCAQWMCRSREPGSPSSVTGVRPADIKIGTLAREAVMMAVAALPVPTLTCTITAAGRPPAAEYRMRADGRAAGRLLLYSRHPPGERTAHGDDHGLRGAGAGAPIAGSGHA